MEILQGFSVFLRNICRHQPDIGIPNVEDDWDNELQPRNGLSKMVQKNHAKDTIRKAFIGRLFTKTGGWRVYSFDRLKVKFPSNNVVQIHAAIGIGGSGFGSYLIRAQMKAKKPNSAFVESAIDNDGESKGLSRPVPGFGETIHE